MTGIRSLACSAALALIPFAAIAQQGPPQGVAPAPCKTDPNARRFDFWVGDWTVTTMGGQRVGESSVQIVSGGCALLENWTSASGGMGKSLNAYNRRTKMWQQYWVGQTGDVTEYLESEWRGDGALVYHGTGSRPDGSATMSKLTFTPQPDGAVRQTGELSADGGKTWAVTYDFLYKKKG
jgi:hypothetical protein